MDFFEQFQEPQPPPKETFYSLLTEKDISETDYIHVQRNFNHFDVIDLGDYHDFYLLTNVLLLWDMPKNF